ncbi:phage tail protein [Hymenobacter sp. BT18]|uniref:phage tail protein n=1 Tax=Hymenobacter sp. BT18 TaxID=2835648 RepID=UPI00143E8FE3|nr:tail fiber protein [Hymenobacter sp. BT18]QIX59835.1 phage tail protein [Hymenobacter sp. BT18]
MDAFIGEIRLMPYNFAPKYWAQCLGQLLPIQQNTALFSIIGNYYGGDGRITFALPNLAGATAIGAGSGAGLSGYSLGEMVGVSSLALQPQELPAHTHTVTGSILTVAETGTSNDPSVGYLALSASEEYGETVGNADMALNCVSGGPTSVAGGNAPHDNMMPYLTLNYCICLQGIFPQRP